MKTLLLIISLLAILPTSFAQDSESLFPARIEYNDSCECLLIYSRNADWEDIPQPFQLNSELVIEETVTLGCEGKNVHGFCEVKVDNDAFMDVVHDDLALNAIGRLGEIKVSYKLKDNHKVITNIERVPYFPESAELIVYNGDDGVEISLMDSQGLILSETSLENKKAVKVMKSLSQLPGVKKLPIKSAVLVGVILLENDETCLLMRSDGDLYTLFGSKSNNKYVFMEPALMQEAPEESEISLGKMELLEE